MMGVRSLICVYYQGRFVVAQYAQFNGFPEGHGSIILKFLQNEKNIKRLKDGLEHVYLPPPAELAEIDKKAAEMENANRQKYPHSYFMMNPMLTHWPSLSREIGGNILEQISDATAANRVPLRLDLEFANDRLLCEWAYVVDLDKEIFEIYGDWQWKSEAENGRWQDVGPPDAPVPFHMDTLTFEKVRSITEEAFVESFAQSDDEDGDDVFRDYEDAGSQRREGPTGNRLWSGRVPQYSWVPKGFLYNEYGDEEEREGEEDKEEEGKEEDNDDDEEEVGEKGPRG